MSAGMPFTLTIDRKKPDTSHSQTKNMSRDHVTGRLLGCVQGWVENANEHGEIKLTITITKQSNK